LSSHSLVILDKFSSNLDSLGVWLKMGEAVVSLGWGVGRFVFLLSSLLFVVVVKVAVLAFSLSID
jgi:hypothetical protein